MRRTWTIIGVADVAGSFKWYQSLFGLPETAPAHTYFGQVLDPDGTVLICLHEWGAHDHPSLMSPEHATPGNGLLLFFGVDDFDSALQRARTLVTALEEELYQTRTRSDQDLLNFPIRLTNRMSALRSSVEGGDARPTDAAAVVFQELSAELDQKLARLQSILTVDLPAFNRALAGRNLATIPPGAP